MTSYNGHLLRFQGCWHLKDSKTLQERKEGNYCFHIYCVPHEYGSCSFITEFDSGGSMWKKCKGENFNSCMTHKCLINVLIIIHHRQEHFFNLLYIYLIYIYLIDDKCLSSSSSSSFWFVNIPFEPNLAHLSDERTQDDRQQVEATEAAVRTAVLC